MYNFRSDVHENLRQFSSFSVVREELDENVTTNISCKCETVYVSTLIVQSCEVHSVISP